MTAPLGPVGELSLALLHVWEPERPFVIITGYIDESGIHGGPAMVMGCLVGNVWQWKAFDAQWRQHLTDNGLTYYHSKRLRHGNREFKGWDAHRKLAFMQRAAKITEDHTMFGVTVVLGYDDYKQYYIAGDRPREVPLDSMYGLCFRFCLLRVVDIALYRLGDPDDLSLHFVLEDGHKNFGDAQRIFTILKDRGNERFRHVLKTITSAGKKDFFGLQGADAGAYHILHSERGREKPPSDITIPGASKYVRMADKPWLHYNFIISPEKITEFRSEIMEEVTKRRARRKSNV